MLEVLVAAGGHNTAFTSSRMSCQYWSFTFVESYSFSPNKVAVPSTIRSASFVFSSSVRRRYTVARAIPMQMTKKMTDVRNRFMAYSLELSHSHSHRLRAQPAMRMFAFHGQVKTEGAVAVGCSD